MGSINSEPLMENRVFGQLMYPVSFSTNCDNEHKIREAEQLSRSWEFVEGALLSDLSDSKFENKIVVFTVMRVQ